MASHVQLFKHFVQPALKNIHWYNDYNKGSLNSHGFLALKSLRLKFQVPAQSSFVNNEFNRKE